MNSCCPLLFTKNCYNFFSSYSGLPNTGLRRELMQRGIYSLPILQRASGCSLALIILTILLRPLVIRHSPPQFEGLFCCSHHMFFPILGRVGLVGGGLVRGCLVGGGLPMCPLGCMCTCSHVHTHPHARTHAYTQVHAYSAHACVHTYSWQGWSCRRWSSQR